MWAESEWKNCEKGYILIDVLVGTVFAVLMTVMLGGMIMQSRMLQAKEYHMAAEYLARQQIDSLCLDEEIDQLLHWQKEINGMNYQVSSQVETLSNPYRRVLKVRVNWLWLGRAREISLEQVDYDR